ncbi:MAG: glycosyltransferase family 9 protein [Candidatus Saelkia tenebricola]|nr:glycosyltransferase family 9 protein [Candidatus Saelkia tenebricola]
MKILIMTLSNIGDAVLTTSVLECVKKKFPLSSVDILAAERAKPVFTSDPRINEIIIYNKKSGIFEKLSLCKGLRTRGYDLVLDLRNTFASYFIAKRVLKSKNPKTHMYIKHNTVLRKFFSFAERLMFKPKIYWSPEDVSFIDSLGLRDYLVISPAARSDTKSYPLGYFKELIVLLRGKFPDIEIVLVGEDADRNICQELLIDSRVRNLAGETNISQLGYFLSKSRLVITNDSAVLHVASSVNVPTIALFGPTSESKYGPLADNSIVLRRHYVCSPCEKAQCKFGDKRCLAGIKPDQVFNFASRFLMGESIDIRTDYKRILLTRVDKIGDLVLTIPMVEIIRKNFPNSFISFLSSVKTKALIENNPYLDQVITLDKKTGFLGFLRLLKEIRKSRFDIVFNFHPTNRVHLLCFLGQIGLRVGYDWKAGWFNNCKAKHLKQLGEKSEADYNAELLGKIGINESSHIQTIIPDECAVSKIDKDLKDKDIRDFIMIHPGASCKSKLWPLENFIALAKKIAQQKRLKLVFILGLHEDFMRKRIEDELGSAVEIYQNLELRDLIALISSSSALISNDSGPMHIADAFSKPLIAIFGRNQPGLSFKRWGPLGKDAIVIYKDPGCKECLAHNCQKSFVCLRGITVDDVYKEFEKILSVVG